VTKSKAKPKRKPRRVVLGHPCAAMDLVGNLGEDVAAAVRWWSCTRVWMQRNTISYTVKWIGCSCGDDWPCPTICAIEKEVFGG
jgi:hypothetical protein